MKSYFVLDNRRPFACQAMEMEASLSSLSKNTLWFLAQYRIMSERNSSWLPPITSVAVASSPSTCKLIPPQNCDLSTLQAATAMRFTATNSQQTWAYFNNALTKISSASSAKGGVSTGTKGVESGGVITLITTDYATAEESCLPASTNDPAMNTGGAATPSLSTDGAISTPSSPLSTFCALVRELLGMSYRVRIVCVQVGAGGSRGQMASTAKGISGLGGIESSINAVEEMRRLQMLFQSIKRSIMALPNTDIMAHTMRMGSNSSPLPALYPPSYTFLLDTCIMENAPLYYEELLRSTLQGFVRPLTHCQLAFGGDDSDGSGKCGNRQQPGVRAGAVRLCIMYTLTPLTTDGLNLLALHRGSQTQHQESQIFAPPTSYQTPSRAAAHRPEALGTSNRLGLQHPQLFCVISRSSLHPACIKGNSLMVTPIHQCLSSPPRDNSH